MAPGQCVCVCMYVCVCVCVSCVLLIAGSLPKRAADFMTAIKDEIYGMCSYYDDDYDDDYWRASEASETLSGVTQLKSGIFVGE